MTSNPQSAERARRWATSAVALALCIWMAIVWWHFGRTVIRFYSPLPYFDYWNTVPKIDDYKRLHIAVLWQQHGEHRIVFPEIVFAADYIFFRGREILPIALSAFFYFSTWLLLSAMVYRNRLLPAWSRLCAILLAGIVMGWESGAFLVTAPFLIVWPLMLVTGALALFLLTRVPGSRHSWMYFATTIACCAVCSYSVANGLLLWPVILLAAWTLRLTKFQFAILAVSAAALIGLYFVDYRFSHGTNAGGLLTHPFYALSFVAAYLGMPFTLIGPGAGLAVGFFELAAYLALILLALRRRLLSTSTSVVLLGFYLLCLLTAATTAVGRMNPQDPAFGAATAHRYIIVPLAAHAALILAAARLCGNSRYFFRFSFIAAFALCSVLSGKSRHIRDWCDFAKDSLSNCQLASLAFESGVDDPGLMGTVFPGGEALKTWLPILRKNRLSTFADGRTDWLGKPVSSVFRFVSEERQAGAITASYPFESGLAIFGWTDSPRRIWNPQKLVLVDDQKRIVGFGKKLPGGLPHGLASSETPQSIAWVGFVNLSFQSKAFLPYTIEGHGKNLFLAGKPTVIPPIRVLHADQVGAPIPSIRWNMQGTWIKNGRLPGWPPDTSPAIPYYESYAGRDPNIGVLTSSPFVRPPGNCLVIASAHGPSIEDLSERIINADTRETIASTPLLSRYSTWRFWSIALPANAQHLQIIAEDGGHGLDQWLAISEPHLCK